MNKIVLTLSIIAFVTLTGCSSKKEQVQVTPVATMKTDTLSINPAIARTFSEAIAFQNHRDYAQAIDRYNSIINYYQGKEDKGILSSAYLNKFECSLLIDRGYRKQDLEDFLRRFASNPKDLMAFEILYILDTAKGKSMDSEIERWVAKYRNQRLDDWTFKYIEDWANRMENVTVRNRLRRYVSIFKKHL